MTKLATQFVQAAMQLFTPVMWSLPSQLCGILPCIIAGLPTNSGTSCPLQMNTVVTKQIEDEEHVLLALTWQYMQQRHCMQFFCIWLPSPTAWDHKKWIRFGKTLFCITNKQIFGFLTHDCKWVWTSESILQSVFDKPAQMSNKWRDGGQQDTMFSDKVTYFICYNGVHTSHVGQNCTLTSMPVLP